MTVYFMDSSAISKGYVAEVGSTWITSLIDPKVGHVIVLSQLAIVEVNSVFARKQRFSLISAADAAQARANFLFDVKDEYITVALDASTAGKQPVIQISASLSGCYTTCLCSGGNARPKRTPHFRLLRH